MVNIVGLGPGNVEYLTYKAVKVLEESEVIIGFNRALQDVSFIKVERVQVKGLEEILAFIDSNRDKNISIIASGDPCFYGIVNYIKRNYIGDINVIPGISSFQFMMAKLNKSWHNSYLGSLHGREEEFVQKVMKYPVSIWLTDKTNTPQIMCRKLYEQKVMAKVYIGENLSYESEKITVGDTGELKDKEFSELSVVVIENDLFKG